MKVDTVLVDKGISLAELARRLGVSRQAVSKWDEIPEKWTGLIDEMVNEPVMGEKVEDIFDWSASRIKAEVCSRRGRETDYEIARSLGLRVWEFNRLIDKVRRHGIDVANGEAERLPILRNQS